MGKKVKLNVNDLKVQSFVTALNGPEKDRVKGKGDTSIASDCCTPTGTNTGDPCYMTVCGTICGGTGCGTCDCFSQRVCIVTFNC
ncbi:MAG: hypothetical protein QG591_3049 [Planctomycetota bacterium]|nr:hypothetical protein [Planctomycetota bacterium]